MVADHFDRLEVAEFNRRIEAMAQRVGELATQVAVLAARDEQISDKIETMQGSVDDLKETLAKGRGAIWLLTIFASGIAFLVGFWDKFSKWH